MRRHRLPSARFINFTLLLIVVLSFFPLYSYYKGVAAPIPAGGAAGRGRCHRHEDD